MAIADGVTSGPVPVAREPVPFGIAEWGDSTGPLVNQPEFGKYVHYVLTLMTGRLSAGKTNADIVWYNGGGPNNITSPTDFKIPGFQAVYDALNR